uniref:Uncharacterized protein n=1 Tax=Populus trichocarpa TaxID=3694 RepID=A0A3N7FRF4_POPTR
MNHVLEANNSHNGMNSVIRSGGCDVSSIDEVFENHGSSEHLTAAQCLYRAFMSSGGQNMNSHQGSYQTSVTSQQSSYQSMNLTSKMPIKA